MKLWDIRSGQCMFTLTDHSSDVYAITFQPKRPFVFSSCSRDTSIRLFSIDGMVASLKMQLLHQTALDNSKHQLLDEAANTYASKGTYKLCSQTASEMLHKVETGGYTNQFDQLLEFYDYLNFSEGQSELFSILRFISQSTAGSQVT